MPTVYLENSIIHIVSARETLQMHTNCVLNICTKKIGENLVSGKRTSGNRGGSDRSFASRPLHIYSERITGFFFYNDDDVFLRKVFRSTSLPRVLIGFVQFCRRIIPYVNVKSMYRHINNRLLAHIVFT